MRRRALGALLVFGVGFGRAAAEPADPAGKAASTVPRIVGEVTGIDAARREITLKTDSGGLIVVRTDDRTSFLRAQPGARDLSGASPLTLGEVAVGDRLVARGTLAEDKKTLTGRQIVVMTRSDIAGRQEQERADWRRRGLAGVVKSLDPGAGQITVETRSLVGSQTVVVATADRRASFKRYAPDSIRFSDAVPSSFAELQVGDQMRVLGDRTPDGARILAEQVVSGTFHIVSGAVKAVRGGQVTMLDNESGRALTVTVGPDAMVRRLPPETAARLARRVRSGASRPESGDGSARAGGTTLQEMLERLPAMPIEELKTGDQIAVSSPRSRAPGRLIAAVLLAGIEPLLQPRSRRGAGGVEAVGLAPGTLDLELGVP